MSQLESSNPPSASEASSQGPPGDPATLEAVRARLQDYADSLPERERAALSMTLKMATLDPALAALAAEPPESILEPREVDLYRELLQAELSPVPKLPSYLAFIMKATRRCNLRCTYCCSWSTAPNQVMTFEVLARAIHAAFAPPGNRTVQFIWHGGEPTLRPLAFYRKALWLQQRFRRPGQKVINNLQTNGTRLSSEWLEFLARHQFRVGVSLDGPPEIHDSRRRDVAGRATSHKVREGLDALAAHGIEHGVVMVVDPDVIRLGAERLLDYLLEIGVTHAGLLNVVPEGDPCLASEDEPYLEMTSYVDFLRDLFGLWWPDHRDRITFREIDDLLLRLSNGGAGKYCVFGGNCMGGFLTVEPDGDVSGCDKFQDNDAYVFGNLLHEAPAAFYSSPQLDHARTETDADMERASSCTWFDICQGGCPYDRHARARRRIDHDESCCGMAPLINDLSQAVGKAPTTT